MKTRRILLFSLSLCIIAIIFPHTLIGQEIDKTYKWNYKVNPDSRVALGNYDTDIVIHTWDKPEVEFHMIINAEFRNEEDAEEVDDYLKRLKFSSSSGRTELNSRFWKSRTNIMGISTMVLEGLKPIRYRKFKMECILWIPEEASLELNTKYSEVKIEDLGAELILDSYDDEIYAESVGEKASIVAKYSEMEFSDMKDVDLDLYNCDLLMKDVGDLKIITKYSEITAADAGILDIDSYEDELSFENCGDIKFIAKYSELNAGLAGKLVADNYECEFTADKITNARIQAKYSDFVITMADHLDIISFYEGGIESENVKSIEIKETKYAEYNIEVLGKDLIIVEGYEDNIAVERLTTGMQKIDINGKYLDIEMGIAFNFDCRLKANIRYPDLDIDEDIFRTKIHIKEGSDLEYEGIKGTEKTGMPELLISGYEVNLSISEY